MPPQLISDFMGANGRLSLMQMWSDGCADWLTVHMTVRRDAKSGWSIWLMTLLRVGNGRSLITLFWISLCRSAVKCHVVLFARLARPYA